MRLARARALGATGYESRKDRLVRLHILGAEDRVILHDDGATEYRLSKVNLYLTVQWAWRLPARIYSLN